MNDTVDIDSLIIVRSYIYRLFFEVLMVVLPLRFSVMPFVAVFILGLVHAAHAAAPAPERLGQCAAISLDYRDCMNTCLALCPDINSTASGDHLELMCRGSLAAICNSRFPGSGPDRPEYSCEKKVSLEACQECVINSCQSSPDEISYFLCLARGLTNCYIRFPLAPAVRNDA